MVMLADSSPQSTQGYSTGLRRNAIVCCLVSVLLLFTVQLREPIRSCDIVGPVLRDNGITAQQLERDANVKSQTV